MNNSELAQNDNKLYWFEYLYFFMIVIYSAMAISFTRSMMGYFQQPIGFALPIIMTIILLIRNNVTFVNKSFLIIIATYTIWSILQYVKYNYFNITYFFFVYYNITIAYIIISIYKANTFLLYEKIVTVLSFVAIIGWLFMVLVPNSFGNLIDLIKMPGSDILLRGNIIIFSMTNLDIYKTVESFGLTRNSGFSWEPGRYASMVVIALFFNMSRTQFQFGKNIGFWILLLALLTTQSTTGYFSFFILIIFYLLNLKIELKLLYLILIIPLIIITYNLPFIGEKLNTLSDSESSMSQVGTDIENHEIEGDSFVPQRFDGLQFELLNIINDPILGHGDDVNNSYVINNISTSLILSNGILKIFARFGLILGGLFYILLFKSSKWLSNFYNIKGGIIYMLVFMSISVSYDFNLIPFFFAVTIFCLFANEKLRFDRNEINIFTDRVIFESQ